MLSKRAVISIGVVFGVLAVVVIGGCDWGHSDSRDEADLPALLGSWRITDVVVDSISTKQRLDALYGTLVLTLREDAVGTNFFEVLGTTERGTIALRQEGQFFVDSSDDEITLLPEAFRSLVVTYAHEGPTVVRYGAEDAEAEDVLQFLGLGLRGEIDALSLTTTTADPGGESNASSSGS